MKKLLLLTLLFCYLSGFAQDGHKLTPEQYKEIVKKTTALDSLTAKTFSDKIVSTAQTNLEIDNIRSTNRALIFRYNEKGLSDEEIERQEMQGCDNCLTVIFMKRPDGYFLSEVRGSYNDVFPTWEREFLPGADPKAARENFRNREVKSREYNCDLRLTITGDKCKISNAN